MLTGFIMRVCIENDTDFIIGGAVGKSTSATTAPVESVIEASDSFNQSNI